MSTTKILDPISIHGNEWFTLEKDAETIAQHIIRPMTVWLPFNDRGKAFDIVLKRHGHKCICTDTDFFTTDPPGGCRQSYQTRPSRAREKCLNGLTL